MRNLKKFLALVLAFVMAMSLMVTVNASSPTDFSDLGKVSRTYVEAVNVLSALGVIKGQAGNGEDGQFKPQDPITRAETAALLYRIAHNDSGDSQASIYKDYNVFPDVDSEKWYAGAVNYCANSVLLKGDPDGSFYPQRNVTGYEVLVMTLRMLGYGQNGEFEGQQGDWRLQAAMYGRTAGLTTNIKEGTLGQYATREVVAEIMFRALLADMVSYNMLRNYYPAQVLLADDATNRANYSVAIADGRLTLPLNANLMYVNYGIVGKSSALTYDAFGRPSEAWVKDLSTDKTVDTTGDGSDGDAEKYIPNASLEASSAQAITMSITPVAVYDNSITECELTKEINNDKSIAWADITEVLNGNTDSTANGNGVGTGSTLSNGRTGNMDALHTTTDFIGATGRTTEIYKYVDGGTTKWVFVYIDTFLGEVIDVTPAIKDTAGHVIQAATATIALGNDATNSHDGDPLVELVLETSSYEVGELVLIQTPGGTVNQTDAVDSPERAPLTPVDVPNTAAQFTSNAVIVSTRPTTERVTINATVGEQDNKMGIIGTNGKTYMASNTFLAGRNTANDTVLAKWYDVDAENMGITNSMIGRTYDLVLDHHGYIVGMKEIVTSDSTVGVIIGVDSVRIATGKYLSEVEAYMTDGTTKTFQVGKMADELDDAVASGTTYTYFASATEADEAWYSTKTGDEGMYGQFIGIGSLVKFATQKVGDMTCWRIDDYDSVATGTAVSTEVGTVKVNADNDKTVKTGVTDALVANTRKLDDNSVVFVTEYDYRYNAGNANEGNNVDASYNVYNGFKALPTIEVGTTGHIVYQQLQKPENQNYFLIGKADACNDYIIRNQSTINVDDSYLLLSRGPTYAEYSEYNVLKNGELTTLKVANGNNSLNAAIEATMTGGVNANQLIVVTGTNSKGYVTSVSTVSTLAGVGDDQAIANTGSLATFELIAPVTTTVASPVSYKAGVLTVAATTFLTVDTNVIVKVVNRDLGTTYDISMSEAMRYAQGVDKSGSAANTHDQLASHGLVFELNEYGYVCALYVIDDWEG